MGNNTYYFNNQKLVYKPKDKVRNVNSYVRYMLSRTASMFEWEGLPETIPAFVLELQLQMNGFSGIAQYDGNLYAFYGGMGGEPNPNYLPTKYVVANPALKMSKEYKINQPDADCVLIKGDTMLQGLLPIYQKYGTLLAENELSINLVDIVSRCLFVMSAGTDAAKKAAEKYIEDVFKGDLGVIWDPAALETVHINPAAQGGSQTATLKTLIELEQYLKAAAFQEIGINANYNMKREAINGAEAALNDDALLPLVDDMLRCRQIGADAVNDMFGTDIKVKLASSWKYQEITNEAAADMLEAQAEQAEKQAETAEEPEKEEEPVGDPTGEVGENEEKQTD